MRSLPLRVRITLVVTLSATVAGLFLAFGGGLATVEESITENALNSTAQALDGTVAALLGATSVHEARLTDWATAGQARQDRGQQLEVFDDWVNEPGMSRTVLDGNGRPAVIDSAGQVVVGGRSVCRVWSRNVSCDERATSASALWSFDLVEARANAAVGDGPRALVGHQVDVGGEPYLIILERDVTWLEGVTVKSGLRDLAVIVLPFLIMALGVITWLSLGRALRPVASMIAQVNQIGAESLDQRVPVPAADDELQQLAVTMNRMLDRLERSNEHQRQFVSDASHELRSPITAASATLEVARADPDQADWHRVAAVVEEEIGRLAHLVDDLLLLTRLDEDRRPSRTGEVDLEELCLAEAERPHRVDVSVRVLAPARVTGDVTTLVRAIRNVIDNAANHATSAVRVEVDGRPHSGDPWAEVRVADDGPGVPAEHGERIFERFVRLDESRQRRDGGGAGLGLAIARRIAERHGGALHLEPSEAGGALFVLRLPR